MGLVDLLRRLGILRWGAVKGTYTNAAERPTELMMDGVFDARADLSGGAARREKRAGGATDSGPGAPGDGGGRRP